VPHRKVDVREEATAIADDDITGCKMVQPVEFVLRMHGGFSASVVGVRDIFVMLTFSRGMLG
jgi:hypothetical protein